MKKRPLPTTDNARLIQELDNIIFNGIELSNIDNQICISTRVIAEGAEIKHQAVVNMINKNREYIEEHGNHVVFEIRDKSKSGREKEAFLNEAQATFLLTLLKNTKPVIQFKSNLVKAFTKLHKEHVKLIKAHATIEYQQNKEMGIVHRRDLTDEIKFFIEYAKEQGSKNSHFLYSTINKWINKACRIESIHDVSAVELANVSTANDIALNVINQGINDEECYTDIKKSIKANLNSFALLINGGVA